MAPAPAPAGSRGFQTKYCAGSAGAGAGAGFLFKKPAVSRGFFKIFDQKFFLASTGHAEFKMIDVRGDVWPKPKSIDVDKGVV